MEENSKLKFGDRDRHLDIPLGDFTDETDASCIFCERFLSSDIITETWVQCFQDQMGAHTECASTEKYVYMCDYCK